MRDGRLLEPGEDECLFGSVCRDLGCLGEACQLEDCRYNRYTDHGVDNGRDLGAEF